MSIPFLSSLSKMTAAWRGAGPQICPQGFHDAQVGEPVDLHFEVDRPRQSALANPELCSKRSLPGLQDVLANSSLSTSDFNQALKTGLRVSGAALGIPGLCVLEAMEGANGPEFLGIRSDHTKQSLPGRVDPASGYWICQVSPEREIELYSDWERNLVIESRNRDTSLVTHFEPSGKPTLAQYRRSLNEGRLITVSLSQGQATGEIGLYQSGTLDNRSCDQTVIVGYRGIQHSCSDVSPDAIYVM